MEVTFEQASNNTVDVEFVVRLSPLALPTPEHRLAFHPQLPFHQRSLSETENLRSYLVNFCITSTQTLHTQCLLVHHYLHSVRDALTIQLFVQQCMKEPSLKAPSVRWRLLTDSQAVGQCCTCAGAPTSLSHDCACAAGFSLGFAHAQIRGKGRYCTPLRNICMIKSVEFACISSHKG